MHVVEQALQFLPQALHAAVKTRWQSLVDACAQQDLLLPEDATFQRQLLRVYASSDFVALSCNRKPALLDKLQQSGDLERSYSPLEYDRRLHSAFSDVEDENRLSALLRQFRMREMVRIAWRDLAGLAPLTEILHDLSDLAEAAIEQSLSKLYAWQCNHFGTPRNAQGQPQQLVVLGMGKLGGRELNFSSDIDLIFAYPENGQADGPRDIDNEAFFRRLGQSLIKTLQEPTAEGFVYRVDMRLRPFGDSGPLVMPFSVLEDYYQTHGREWERYAMIKARAVAGDKTAGERLLNELRPFIYRRYLDFGAFASLRNMKALISKNIIRKGLQDNIKLGPGGIREIEFIGQAFQLIYGGWEPELRERGIIRVLDYLAQSGRLPVPAVADLKQAYDFLRRVENRLQAWADQQNHCLPQDEPARLRLAFAMGFTDWSSFTAQLTHHTRKVAQQFQQIFAATADENTSPETFELIWDSSKETAVSALKQYGFDSTSVSAENAWQSLQRLRTSFSYRTLSEQGHERLHQLLPLLLQEVAASSLSHADITLERIVRLLEAILRRSVYLALLLESRVALTQLIKLCAASPWIAEYLTRYPLLLDDLIDPGKLYQPRDRALLAQELNRDLDPIDDPEQRIDALRHFKQSGVLRVAAADISGAMPLMIVSDHLTDIAEVILHKVLDLAWLDLLPRFGRPGCLIDGSDYEPGFAVIGYGKLGGIELGYGSDLDIVFLHDSEGERQWTNGKREIDNVSFFAKLAQRIIHILSVHTAAGVLYEVDTRLRPSGRSGLLVSSVKAFTEYQHKQAWTWEHQALVRARFIAGPPSLKQRFDELRSDILCQPRDHATLRKEVCEMREKMRQSLGSKQAGLIHLKQDRGGIADIEFMVQYLVLAYAHDYPALIEYSDNIRQLDAIEQASILPGGEATLLRDEYRAARRRSHLLKLQEQSSLIPENTSGENRQEVIRLWHKLMSA